MKASRSEALRANAAIQMAADLEQCKQQLAELKALIVTLKALVEALRNECAELKDQIKPKDEPKAEPKPK